MALLDRLGQDATGLAPHLVEVDAEALENPGRHAFALTHEADEQVLGSNVVMVQPAGFIDRQLDDFLRARREADLTRSGPLAPPDDELHGRTYLVQLDTKVGEHLSGNPIGLSYKAKQDVLGAYVVVIEPLGLFLSQRQYPPGPFREFFKPTRHFHFS